MEPSNKHASSGKREGANGIRVFISIYRESAPYLILGGQLALTVVALFLVGWWADKQLETTPWLMLTGTMIGAVAGMVNFFRAIISLARKQEGAKQEK